MGKGRESVLTQASQTAHTYATLAVWFGVLILATAALALVIVVVKRRLFRADKTDSMVWTIHELIAMRDSGELSDQEYQRLRDRSIKQVNSAISAPEVLQDGRSSGYAGGGDPEKPPPPAS